jgi:hypothetical protein
MNYIDDINKLEDGEVKSYIKSHLNDELFVLQVCEQKEKMIPLLLSNKIITDEICFELAKNEEGLSFLVSSLIEYKFIPSVKFIESLSDHKNGDLQIFQIIQEFPSVSLSIQFLMKLINLEFHFSASALVKTKKEFQKVEILLPALRTGSSDSELIEIATEIKDFNNTIIYDINEKAAGCYSRSLLNQVIKKTDISSLNFDEGMKLDLSSDSFNQILLTCKNKGYSYSYSRENRGTPVTWKPEFEKIEKSSFDSVFVTDAPEDSKFRAAWIKEEPNQASDDEILNFFKNKYINEKVCSALLRRSLDLIQKIDLESFVEKISPGKMVDAVRGDQAKLIYLFNNAPSKYRPAIKKSLPLDSIPETNRSRQKTYFTEIFTAIKSGEIDSFRTYLSKGYSLNQFVQDSYQSSKKGSCELVSLGFNFMLGLEKEEFLLLSQTPIRICGYELDGQNKLNFQLTAEEAVSLENKISATACYSICAEKTKFILDRRISEKEIDNIFNNDKETILKDSKLFQAYVSRCNSGSMNFSTETIVELAKVFTGKDLKKLADPKHNRDEVLVNLQCKDGEYYLSREDILSLISKKYALESDSFVRQVKSRDEALAKEIIEAYLKGNKGLSQLVGHEVKIRRGDVSRFKMMLDEMSRDPAEIVDEIFSKGGKLESFKTQLTDWQDSLSKYGKGREVVVGDTSVSNLSEFGEMKTINFLIKLITRGWGSPIAVKYSNIKIESVEIENTSEFESLAEFLKSVRSAYGVESVVMEDHVDTDQKIEMTMLGIYLTEPRLLIEEVTSEDDFRYDSKKLNYLINNGLILSNHVINKIIQGAREDDVISLLIEKVGSLDGFVIDESQLEYRSKEYGKLLRGSGAQILSSEEIEFLELKQKLLESGANFEPISLDKFPTKIKIEIIKLIESKVDSNYSKLNLISSNIDAIEMIFPYAIMKNLFSLDDKDIVSLFNIPTSVSSNKKIMKGIKDLLTVKSGVLAYKVESFKNILNTLNPSIELTVADFLDYSDQVNVVESVNFGVISSDALIAIQDKLTNIQNQSIILKNKSKAEITRFLRSASEKDARYVQDTLEMIESVLRGLDALKERASTIEISEDTISQREELNASIDSVSSRLEEVASMDDIIHMHDRLVPLLSFIKTDIGQPLGQDKFIKLEKSEEASAKLGFKLFFPKTRGDLVYLGDENGWCVNHHSSYGDGVVSKGNILVAICPNEDVASKENAVALAHYINNGKDQFRLEQLRWSKKKKNGSTNIDATRDFDHALIISTISEYLEVYKKSKKKE